MKVKEAIELLSYGQDFFVRGSHLGKTYYRSWINQKSQLSEFAEMEVTQFFTEIIVKKKDEHGYYNKEIKAYEAELISLNVSMHSAIGLWVEDFPKKEGDEK